MYSQKQEVSYTAVYGTVRKLVRKVEGVKPPPTWLVEKETRFELLNKSPVLYLSLIRADNLSKITKRVVADARPEIKF